MDSEKLGPDGVRVFEALPMPAILVNDQGLIVGLNQASVELAARIGMPTTREDRLGRPVADLSGEEDRQQLTALVRDTLSTGRSGYQLQSYRDAAGLPFWVELRVHAVRDPEGRTIGALVLREDVTERRQTEQELRQSEERFRQAQKMEAMGHLAAGAAHDFNNLLTAVMGFAELGRKLIADGVPAVGIAEVLAEILRAGERGRDLTGQLLTFSRRQPGRMEVIDLNRLVSGLRTMFRQLLGEEIELTTRLDPELVRVEGDAGQLQQVLVNLVANARDAMPHGGRLTIATANREVGEPRGSEDGPMPPGRYALLSVSDTGTGIAPEIKARIFEPFFTTKEGGQGTGLGLAMAYGTAAQHRGHLSVESEWGEGATFYLYLPASARTEAVAATAAPAPETAAKRGLVLVVDDDTAVRSVVARLLRFRGYEALTAGSGQEAMDVAMAGAEPVRLLVTDVAMPGMSGPELAATLRALLPDLRVLYISGYAEGSLSEEERTRPGADFLQKPLMPDDLAERVRRLLDLQL